MKFSSLTIIIFIAALLVDSLLSDVSSIVNRSLSELTRIVLFSTIVGIAILSGSGAILHNIRKIKTDLGSKNKTILLISQIMPFIEYTMIGLLILITLQIIFTTQYLTLLLVASQALSWSTGVILMGVMSFKFIQWYRAKKNLLVLLYLVSSLMFCGTLGATIIPQTSITIQSSSFYVNSHSTEVKPFQANPETLSTLFAIISVANWLVLPLAYIIWAATAIMLNHYSKIFGRKKYWIILSIPLISLIAGTISWLFFLPTMNSIFDQQVIFYTMMAFGGILAEGFLLCFTFIIISRSMQIKTHSKLKDYLRLSAIGLAILFASFFANPSAGSYLPFGVLSASFFAFGAYLFLVGIYSSASSIAFDSRLRQTVRKSSLDQSKLLDNIALADINRALEKHTGDMLKKHKETMNEAGIESSISESDMKNYVNEVMGEIRKVREAKSSSGNNTL
jgi:hypothetical protein